MNEDIELATSSAKETQRLGRLMGSNLRPGDLLLLSGELGTGKTTLVQGVAWGLGVTSYAHSPTFALVHEYVGRIPLYHLDLYRVENATEIAELGFEEMLHRGACAVEWAEKAPTAFPEEHLHIQLSHAGPRQRHVLITIRGPRASALAQRVVDGTAL